MALAFVILALEAGCAYLAVGFAQATSGAGPTQDPRATFFFAFSVSFVWSAIIIARGNKRRGV